MNEMSNATRERLLDVIDEMKVDEMEQKKHSGNKLSVEEHRLEIEGTKFESHLDWMCEKVKGHPVFGVEDRLLNWRYNKDDLDKLRRWIGRMVDFETSPCRICGDPIYICERNPDTNHYFLVVGDDGEIIGESERVVGDRVVGDRVIGGVG